MWSTTLSLHAKYGQDRTNIDRARRFLGRFDETLNSKDLVRYHIPGQIYVQWSEPTRVYCKPESRRLQSCKAASVLN